MIERARPHAQRMSDRVKTLLTKLEDVGRLAHGAGIAVAVAQSDGLLFQDTFGMRDCGVGLPVTQNTVFPIGSATKAFTAAALLRADDRELLNLDAPLN